MKMVEAAFLLFCLTSLVWSSMGDDVIKPNFNPETDGVVKLTQENFKTQVLNSDDAWLVDFDFPGPDCSPCTLMREIIKKAVPLLKEKNIKVGYVDCTTSEGQPLAAMYGISMYPAVYIFGQDKGYPITHPLPSRTAEEFANTVEFFLKAPRAAEGRCGQNTEQDKESNTYELTDENFEEVVLKCEDPWIINFYVPAVRICTEFMPYFEAAAKEFKGRAKFGSFYLLGSKIAEKYDAKNLCTVLFFPMGDKNAPPVNYNSGLHSIQLSTDLIPWIKTALAANLSAPDITELTSQSVLDSKCKNSGVNSCIFLFLAKSDQCNDECKSNSLNFLKEMATNMKAENWAWLWTTQEKQPDFVRTFGICCFPGAFGVDLKANTYSVLRGTAKESKLKEFLQLFSSGRLPSKNMPTGGFPNVKNN